MLVLVGQASLTQHLVTDSLMATVIQHPYGLGGAMVLVVASVVGGEGGDSMDTLGGRF